MLKDSIEPLANPQLPSQLAETITFICLIHSHAKKVKSSMPFAEDQFPLLSKRLLRAKQIPTNYNSRMFATNKQVLFKYTKEVIYNFPVWQDIWSCPPSQKL